MRIAHFTLTRLAGAPIRLVHMLNRHTPVCARLIAASRYEFYDHDLVFNDSEQSREQAVALAEAADILHLHNYIDRDCNAFHPINFRALERRGKRIVRHFHSTPDWIAHVMGISVADLLADDTPSVVIAQHPERLFTRAMLVPNLIPEDEPAYLPSETPTDFDVIFTPTFPDPAFAHRWNTKARPEVEAMLARLAKQRQLDYRVVSGLSLCDALALKRRAKIVLDDMVTGAWHLTGLEGLSMGKPVLAHLDQRSAFILRRFAGVEELPHVNVRLEDAPEVLNALLDDPKAVAQIGAYSRRFVAEHYHAAKLADMYVAMYERLLADPTSIRRQPEFDLDRRPGRFFHVGIPDAVHAARSSRPLVPTP